MIKWIIWFSDLSCICILRMWMPKEKTLWSFDYSFWTKWTKYHSLCKWKEIHFDWVSHKRSSQITTTQNGCIFTLWIYDKRDEGSEKWYLWHWFWTNQTPTGMALVFVIFVISSDENYSVFNLMCQPFLVDELSTFARKGIRATFGRKMEHTMFLCITTT